MRMMIDYFQRRHLRRLVRKAINTYPGGICFAYPSGMTILANPVMNTLCYELTGMTVINAEHTWDLLQSEEKKRNEDICLTVENVDIDKKTSDTLGFRLKNDSVWQLKRESMQIEGQDMYQYTAEDITELYDLSVKLRDAVSRRREYQLRQRQLMKDIVRINEAKELLQAKIRIHDDFGRCLVVARQCLQTGTIIEDGSFCREWENAIREMNHLTELSASQPQTAPSPETELLRVAELIGCRITFEGRQPRDRNALLLMYAAIREALTNAVRHGGADSLYVKISEERGGYTVLITDNGTGCPYGIREGTGLGNLRRRLENEGAEMEIADDDGVKMRLWLPGEENSVSSADC